MGKQHELIVDLFKANKTAREAISLLSDIYGSQALNKSQVYRIFADLKAGKDGKDGRGQNVPKRSRTHQNIEAVRSVIEADRRITMAEIKIETGLSHGTINRIIHQDLQMSKLSARWVPRLLTAKHKQDRVRCAKKFLKAYFQDGKAFLEKIITVDETWLSYTTPETKNQSKQWLPRGSGPPRKAKVVASDKKVMVIAFFDIRGLIYTHYVPKGQTINAAYYIDVLEMLQRHIRKKDPSWLKMAGTFIRIMHGLTQQE